LDERVSLWPEYRGSLTSDDRRRLSSDREHPAKGPFSGGSRSMDIGVSAIELLRTDLRELRAELLEAVARSTADGSEAGATSDGLNEPFSESSEVDEVPRAPAMVRFLNFSRLHELSCSSVEKVVRVAVSAGGRTPWPSSWASLELSGEAGAEVGLCLRGGRDAAVLALGLTVAPHSDLREHEHGPSTVDEWPASCAGPIEPLETCWLRPMRCDASDGPIPGPKGPTARLRWLAACR